MLALLHPRKERRLMHDVHSIAERYLRDINTGRVDFYEREKTDIVPTAHVVERVVVMRDETPHYLAGVKPSGRLVWTSCLKMAASFDSPSGKLADVVERLEVYDTLFELMPACWFSRHHG